MPEKLRDSFALYGADHRLVDFDDGFVEELQPAGIVPRPGMRHADMLRAATAADPAGAAMFGGQFQPGDGDGGTHGQIAAFGNDRSCEYRTVGGRIVRVDEYRTQAGGVRRSTRDVTDERAGGTAVAEAGPRQDAQDCDLHSAPIEIRRNADGTYVFPKVSEAIRRLLDLPSDTVGMDTVMMHLRMTASTDQASLSGAIERSAETLEMCSFEFRVYDGSNRLRWIRQSMMPRRLADGATLLTGALRDVTREKDAEEQVELLRSVVVKSSDSIAIFETSAKADEGTRIVYLNAKFTELFGGCADELVGQPIEALRPMEDNGQGRGLISAALQRDDGVPAEFEAAGRDGRIFWAEVRAMTVQKFADGGFRWVVISRDISDRRHAQDTLIRAKDAAEAGNLAKSNFLANMSHELRTPLNAIIGFTELIEQGVGRTGWTPAYTEYLADVTSSGRHLLDLINTILDLSKIEAGLLKLESGPVDLRDILRSSLALVSGLARDGRIAVHTDIPSEFREIPGDFLKLKQVILNIVSNAIKFTPPGGKIAVSLGYTATDAVITVKDSGCGIAEADLTRVKRPFIQVGDTLSRKHGGSGLGLSIAEELCGLHGGRLTIRSIRGIGTRVRISLPLGGGEAGALPTWPRDLPEGERESLRTGIAEFAGDGAVLDLSGLTDQLAKALGGTVAVDRDVDADRLAVRARA